MVDCSHRPYATGKAIIAVSIFFCLTGCTVGPDFNRPEAPASGKYTPAPLPGETAGAPGAGGEVQRFIIGQDIPAQWWTLFRSEALDRLVRQALADSPTLAAARSILRQAQENRRAQFGALLPAVDVNASASREKISGAEFGEPNAIFPPFALFNASVTVSYALDISGGTRRELEALQSQVDYQNFQLEGAYLTLTANIVTTAVREASLRSQIWATQEILAAQEKQLEVIGQQFYLGGESQSAVLSQRTQLAQTRATLPPIEKELAQTRHLLAVLVGKLPGEAAALPMFDLDGLQLPQEIPVSLPSALVRQRPDIRASEALFHAACAQVGVATANLYPQVTLTGSYGSEATRLQDLFGSGSTIWSLGAGLLQPVFHGGSLSQSAVQPLPHTTRRLPNIGKQFCKLFRMLPMCSARCRMMPGRSKSRPTPKRLQETHLSLRRNSLNWALSAIFRCSMQSASTNRRGSA